MQKVNWHSRLELSKLLMDHCIQAKYANSPCTEKVCSGIQNDKSHMMVIGKMEEKTELENDTKMAFCHTTENGKTINSMDNERSTRKMGRLLNMHEPFIRISISGCRVDQDLSPTFIIHFPPLALRPRFTVARLRKGKQALF